MPCRYAQRSPEFDGVRKASISPAIELRCGPRIAQAGEGPSPGRGMLGRKRARAEAASTSGIIKHTPHVQCFRVWLAAGPDRTVRPKVLMGQRNALAGLIEIRYDLAPRTERLCGSRRRRVTVAENGGMQLTRLSALQVSAIAEHLP